MLFLHTEAVELALESNNLHLAKEIAKIVVNDDDLKKELWISIIRHQIVRDVPLSEIVKLANEDGIRIEEILQYFPDFVIIDGIKDEVCAVISKHNEDLNDLKITLEESAKVAFQIRQEINERKKRFLNSETRCISVPVTARCDISGRLLLSGPFFVFPCNHSFLKDILHQHVHVI